MLWSRHSDDPRLSDEKTELSLVQVAQMQDLFPWVCLGARALSTVPPPSARWQFATLLFSHSPESTAHQHHMPLNKMKQCMIECPGDLKNQCWWPFGPGTTKLYLSPIDCKLPGSSTHGDLPFIIPPSPQPSAGHMSVLSWGGPGRSHSSWKAWFWLLAPLSAGWH